VFDALRPGGVAVINADDEFAGYWRGRLAGKRVQEFGVDCPAQVSARYVLADSGSRIRLRLPEGEAEIALSVSGRHNVSNACAAAAGALAAGVSLKSVEQGLAAFRAVGGRMQRLVARSGATLIDDSYNANPDSARAAIDVLAAERGTKFLLLGDMGEVGERGVEFHEEIGRYARERGIDRLYAAGDLSRAAVGAFGQGARHFATVEAMVTAAQGEIVSGAAALVKGSRFMRMERVVQVLAASPQKAETH
jgi:UDP-N-acetylmuramoyl-tripeptide--D-alanyl-D-alanine ligase